MKKPNNKNSNKTKNPALAITTTLLESGLLTNLVEKLAVRRYDIGYTLEMVQPGWQAIEASSIEALVSCAASFSTEKEKINLVFTTCFLFTCIKGKDEDFNLTWVNSLS